MTNPKTKRKAKDWEAIERQYRLGQLSNVEIGSMFGVSRQAVQKMAKLREWERDLSNQVAVLARARLSAPEQLVDGKVVSAPSRACAETEDVQTAADKVVQIVRGHRAKLSKMHERLERLGCQLDDQLSRVETDTPEKAALEDRKLYTLDLDKSGKLVAAMAAAISKIIPLERQAFNVDGARPAADQDQDMPESLRERLAIYHR